MRAKIQILIIGISTGVVIGILLAIIAFLGIRLRKRRSKIESSSSRRTSTIPIRTNGVDTATTLSDSTVGQESPKEFRTNGTAFCLERPRRKNVVSLSGIPKYPYRELQKATNNFTTVLGQGAFGPVYKAQLSTGEIVAVKVLASNSRQGEREFQSEVLFRCLRFFDPRDGFIHLALMLALCILSIVFLPPQNPVKKFGTSVY